MKIAIIVILIILVFWFIGSWLVIRNVEEPKYQVISKNNIYEIREYEPYIIAETSVGGEYDKAVSEGFRRIADYIFGNNTKSEKIAMTTPVQDDLGNNSDSEKIAMTAPVIDQGDETERKVSFVMPSEYTIDTIPKPNSGLVTLREIPQRKVAVLKYGWYTNEPRIKKKSEELLNYLNKDGVKVLGEVYSARYNPPLSIPIILRNEVVVEVE